MDDNSKAVRYGVGTSSDHDLAKALVLAALNAAYLPYSVAAMMSEASARVSSDGWRDGINEWQEENGRKGVILAS